MLGREDGESQKFLEEVLDAIEQREARLLVWGLVDGRLSRDEIEAVIDPLLDEALANGLLAFMQASEVVAALRDRRLLFETDTVPYPGYRSRMAEGVRLLFRLRQLFPKHEGPTAWQFARTLVADYRFLWRRRSYPKREIPVRAALESIAEICPDALSLALLEALLNGRGPDYALAEFQVRATARILGQLQQRARSGTIVSAGTGSGKTLAFYLPALSRVGAHIARDPPDLKWVKVLAIYPRTELLRDQFAEIYKEARRLDGFLRQRQRAPIRIGAFFGKTPGSASDLLGKDNAAWRSSGEDFVCGFMGCPADGCDGDLLWKREDVVQRRERLVCGSCGHQVTEEEVVLTRSRLRESPPDILFTTTEMLNRRLGDGSHRHLFGLGRRAARAPEIVLLDEVHSYAGFHGAQVAYLLRRWSHLLRTPLSFVGLSATLRDAEKFFGRLTGLDDALVEEVSPRTADMVQEGAEYLVALRGDPVSRTALLSTTIQTAMTVSRVLDTAPSQPSGGVYGQRVFAFTDDIDVNNRLYFGLLDAEGRDGRGTPDMVRHPAGGLAVLRRPMASQLRDRYGQNWQALQDIGHRLGDRKRIGRTSSQDPGVSAGMDVIVATASLEVGFNDPGVGSVIQHKAPRDVAQFLQRKGRAGRLRSMRPWTVVVLSDYGRDRLAYQAYDQLFDPELPVRTVPLANRYVQRMQAVYSLIDYLGASLQANGANGNVWQTLAGPSEGNRNRAYREALVASLAAILRNASASDDLEDHLQNALGLREADVTALLWEYPRPLLTAVVPTALRRLSSNWRFQGRPREDDYLPNSPLPDFAPSSLFSDLNLPEVRVIVPGTHTNAKVHQEVMPIAQALWTFAGGRVSRRFGTEDGRIRHWIAPTLTDSAEQMLDIGQFYTVLPLGTWLARDGDVVSAVPTFRPIEMRVSSPPFDVSDTSNARLELRTQIVALRRGVTLQKPSVNDAERLVAAFEVLTHSNQAPIEMRRFAPASQADIRFRRRDAWSVRFQHMMDGQPAALGFVMPVDGLRIRIAIPPDLWAQGSTSDAKWRALRTTRYFGSAWSGDTLAMVKSPFARQWLAQIYFAALSYEALYRQVGLEEAEKALAAGTAAVSVTQVLDSIFQSPLITDDQTGGGADDAQDRLRQDLEAHLHNPDVLRGLAEMAQQLWARVDASWEPWLRRCFKATMAAAFFEAVQDLCPEIDPEGLVVDLDPGPRAPEDVYAADDDETEFWVTENTPGGSGLIEAIVRSYAEDPRRFYSLMTAVLRPNEYELIDHQLGQFLDAIAGPSPVPGVVGAVQGFRGSTSVEESQQALAALRQVLMNSGFALFHGFLSALANRVLRPGSTPQADNFLREALRTWRSEELRLGIELDARALAFRLSQDDAIDQIMAAAGLPVPSDNVPSWRFNAIYGLLWARGADVRRASLGLYNPFAEMPESERLLVAEHLSEGSVAVAVNQPGWEAAAMERLAGSGFVTLTAPVSQKAEIAAALGFFATNPVQSDYLSVYVRLDALRRRDDALEADLQIVEVQQ